MTSMYDLFAEKPVPAISNFSGFSVHTRDFFINMLNKIQLSFFSVCDENFVQN